MNDESWHLVKSTPKVTGFVGGPPTSRRQSPRKKSKRSCSRCRDGVEKPRPKVLFEPGEVVRVKDGPFYRFSWLGRTRQLRKESLARFRDHFRSCDAGRTRVRPGRKGLATVGEAGFGLSRYHLRRTYSPQQRGLRVAFVVGERREKRVRTHLKEFHRGKENCRLHQAASAGGQGQSLASDRPRAGSARSQHHGILQGFQRPNPGHGNPVCRFRW